MIQLVLKVLIFSCFVTGCACIAYGRIVDYATARDVYSFMARIITDGLRCGGAVVAPRFVAAARSCLESCPCFKSKDWTSCRSCYVKLREYNDFEPDTETIHWIARIHLPDN